MLLFADSFEHYGTDENNMLAGLWAQFSQGPALSTVFARTGSYSLFFGGPGSGFPQYARFNLGSEKITAGVGFGIYFPQLPSLNTHYYFQFLSPAAVEIFTLVVQSDGSLCARKGGIGGAVIEISDSVITAGTFKHIEFKVVFDDVAGSVEVRVEGVTKMSIGGLDLDAEGASSVKFLNNINGATGYYIDDVLAWDDTGTYNNNFMGPQRILTVYPVSDTAQADWVLNGAGTGVGCINQVAPDGDTTYLGSSLVGDRSEFTLPTLPPELVEITGVFIPSMAKLDAAGIGNLTTSLVSGITPLDGPDTPLTTGYTYYPAVFEYDPVTLIPWTKSGFEAALLRLEKTL